MVTAQDLVTKGFDPLALRYLILNSHYRQGTNFTWEALQGAQTALNNLRTQVNSLKGQNQRTALSAEKQQKIDEYRNKFISALSDDLNVSKALAVSWEMLKSNIPAEDKYDLALSFDEVLGLNITQEQKEIEISDEIKTLIEDRERLRKEGKFEESDQVRERIKEKGFIIEDTPDGVKVKPVQNENLP
jgi:cysteinyl-tRNA synthetase